MVYIIHKPVETTLMIKSVYRSGLAAHLHCTCIYCTAPHSNSRLSPTSPLTLFPLLSPSPSPSFPPHTLSPSLSPPPLPLSPSLIIPPPPLPLPQSPPYSPTSPSPFLLLTMPK